MSDFNVDVLPFVEASLNFTDVDATVGKPYIMAYEDPERPHTNIVHDKRNVRIYNARPLLEKDKSALSLDRNGFEFHELETRVENFYDEEQVQKIYYPEVIELIKAATGAKDVLVFDHTIRAPKEKSHRQPVLSVHNDYTEKSAPKRVRDLTQDPELLEERLRNRFAFINVWRPIHAPGVKIEDFPLALSDARTVKPGDYFPSDLFFKDRVGETYVIKHADHQRWFYFPQMHRDEVIFLKVFESLDDGHTAKFTAHSAFADPTAPADPLPRESIEVRVIAFFGPSQNE